MLRFLAILCSCPPPKGWHIKVCRYTWAAHLHAHAFAHSHSARLPPPFMVWCLQVLLLSDLSPSSAHMWARPLYGPMGWRSLAHLHTHFPTCTHARTRTADCTLKGGGMHTGGQRRFKAKGTVFGLGLFSNAPEPCARGHRPKVGCEGGLLNGLVACCTGAVGS